MYEAERAERRREESVFAVGQVESHTRSEGRRDTVGSGGGKRPRPVGDGSAGAICPPVACHLAWPT
jgi:hypothetical protein